MLKNIILTLILIATVIGGFVNSPIEFSIVEGTCVTFINSGIQLSINNKMGITVYFNKNGQRLSLNDYKEIYSDALPPFFAVINKCLVNDFNLDFDNVTNEKITTVFGNGERVTLHGISSQVQGINIDQKISIELYDDFPNTAIMFAEFKNISVNHTFTIDTVYSGVYQLDASLVDNSSSPNSFYSFYGTDGRPIRQIEKILSKNFYEDNFTGRPDSLEGIKEGNGGIPIVDLWCKSIGIGIGHIETKWQNLYFPIRVQSDDRVLIGIKEIPNMNIPTPLSLKPGESFRTITSFLNVHSLDFYQTAETYSELMRRQGIDMHTKSTDNDYLSAWCSWNDYSTYAMASKKDVMLIAPILQRLPELEKLKIDEIIFDAGWFSNQGDWLPNEDTLSFPGGEADLVSSIEQIHKAGFKVKLWISYLTADPWSEVAKAHSNWMIKKQDGTFHLDRWSGYTMCPSLQEVQTYHSKMAERFVAKYGADGFKVDGMYVCPPCYNPEHSHQNPNESTEDYHKVFKAFYEQAKSINNSITIMACPCGSVCDFTTLPYITQTIAADPKSYKTVRRKAKLYRALKGSDTPFSSDYIDVLKGKMEFPMLFANAIGLGAVPQTFYGQQPSIEYMEHYKKWFSIYSNEMISQAEYLNLYDMHFDEPETHVFRKVQDGENIFYFSFFTEDNQWEGVVEFRGLDKTKEYSVYDYVNNKEIGTIRRGSPLLNLSFEDFLFVRCIQK